MMKTLFKISALVISLASPSISYGLSPEQKELFDQMDKGQLEHVEEYLVKGSKCGFLYLTAIGLPYYTTKSQLEQMSSVIPDEHKSYGRIAIHHILSKLSLDHYNLGLEPSLSIYKKEHEKSIKMLRSEAEVRLFHEDCPIHYINSVKRYNDGDFSQHIDRSGS